jgi:hypothetical protein
MTSLAFFQCFSMSLLILSSKISLHRVPSLSDLFPTSTYLVLTFEEANKKDHVLLGCSPETPTSFCCPASVQTNVEKIFRSCAFLPREFITLEGRDREEHGM